MDKEDPKEEKLPLAETAAASPAPGANSPESEAHKRDTEAGASPAESPAPQSASASKSWAKAAVWIVFFVVAGAVVLTGLSRCTPDVQKNIEMVAEKSDKVYSDLKKGVRAVLDKAMQAGTQTYIYNGRFESGNAADKYIACEITNGVRLSVKEEKSFLKIPSRAKANICGKARFDYYIELRPGYRLEIIQRPSGKPILTFVFSDLKLNRPVVFNYQKNERVKDGFLIDEGKMLDKFMAEKLPLELIAQGEQPTNFALAREHAKEAIRKNLVKLIAGEEFDPDSADIRIEFDSSKLPESGFIFPENPLPARAPDLPQNGGESPQK